MRAACGFAALVLLLVPLMAQEAVLPPLSDDIPPAEEIARLLANEPVSLETWPAWRQRYFDWYYDRLNRTNDMDIALMQFVEEQLEGHGGELPDALRDEAGWHLAARAHLSSGGPLGLQKAREAVQRLLQINPQLAPAHMIRAYVDLHDANASAPPPDADRLAAAERAVAEAKRLDPRTPDGLIRALIADARGDAQESLRQAESYFRDRPFSSSAAVYYCGEVLGAPSDRDGVARLENVLQVAARFPDEGALRPVEIIALLRMDRMAEAKATWDRLREAGGQLEDTLAKDLAQPIDQYLRIWCPAYDRGMKALDRNDYAAAEAELQSALAEFPDRVEYARLLAETHVKRDDLKDFSGFVGNLVQRFPQDGMLHTYHAAALGRDGKWREAARELQAARDLGYDPLETLHESFVGQVEAHNQPGMLRPVGIGVLAFLACYALLIGLMAAAGLVLAFRTRGQPLDIPDVIDGQVHMTDSERWLARCYRGALVLSLLMFYVAIPFVAFGVVGVTGALLYGIFLLPRIPLKPVLIIVVGLGMAWAIVKSVFARREDNALGVQVEERQEPRLWEVMRDVAAKVGTEPIHEIKLLPGAEIGVRQEGRGPFGIFGHKKRHLVLGVATLPGLTVRELKAVMAHEYAHFSHQDTFYSRVIHQVTLSIEQTLEHMARSLGSWNYANPFYWFFYLYYRAYLMLAAGFSRSREYLADRMAASLYGRGAFFSALHKVATQGRLFETTAHANIREQLLQGQAFSNIYEAFRRFYDEELAEDDRAKLDRDVVDGESSLFASHPTIRQRFAALAGYPEGDPMDEQPARSLLEGPEAVEVRLTDLLTKAHHRHMQMAPQSGQ